MELKQLYQALGADYEGTFSRLMGERLMNKYVRKFPADTSFQLLTESIAAQDWETAFRAVHTLKGVCANLGFTRLWQASSDLTEAVRGGKPLNDFNLFSIVEAEYKTTVDAIGGLE